MTVEITLTVAASDTGPFDLYSDVDGYTTPFETGVARAALLAGYTSALAPASTTIVRCTSTGVCTNSIDIVLDPPTTTTTTTAPPTTTTTTTAYVAPQVVTNSVTDVAETTATGAGTPIAGTAPISLRGVCWSTTINPEISDDESNVGGGTTPYTSPITGLAPDTEYYVRAYVFDGTTVAYGDNVTFTTLAVTTTTTTTAFVAPTVTTDPVSSILETSADGNGEIVSEGTTTITERGLCWAVLTNPTKSDSFVVSGAGLGTFTENIGPLLPNTTYYVRAYGDDGSNVYYGNEVNFTTLEVTTTTTTTTEPPTTTTTTTAAPLPPISLTEIPINDVRVFSRLDDSSQAGSQEVVSRFTLLTLSSGPGYISIPVPGGTLSAVNDSVDHTGILPAMPSSLDYSIDFINADPGDTCTVRHEVISVEFDGLPIPAYNDYFFTGTTTTTTTAPPTTTTTTTAAPDCLPLTGTATQVGVDFTMTNGGPDTGIACGQTVFNTYYHGGEPGEPEIGDYIYTDADLSTLFVGSSLFHKLPSGDHIQIVADGLVTAKGTCP